MVTGEISRDVGSMNAMTLPPVTACGLPLAMDDSALGWLESAVPLLEDANALRDQLEREGYLFLPGFFDRAAVLEARKVILHHLKAKGGLAPGSKLDEAIPSESGWRLPIHGAGLARTPALCDLLYGPPLLGFFQTLLRGAVRHYDYTWFRAVGPGPGTKPHCDVVYMGRGTQNVYTSWVPYGDIPLEMGGLMLLEGSHLRAGRLKAYLQSDVDQYCVNRPEIEGRRLPGRSWGWLTRNPVSLREKLGGRWLTAPEFRAGDLLIFGMHVVHGSLDNAWRGLRLSTDSRYQRADEPIDPRWVGENPSGHGKAALRGRIC